MERSRQLVEEHIIVFFFFFGKVKGQSAKTIQDGFRSQFYLLCDELVFCSLTGINIRDGFRIFFNISSDAIVINQDINILIICYFQSVGTLNLFYFRSRYSVVVVDCGGCDTSMFANKLLRSAGSSLQTGFYQAFTFFAVSRNLATPNKSCYYFFAFIFIIIITYQL